MPARFGGRGGGETEFTDRVLGEHGLKVEREDQARAAVAVQRLGGFEEGLMRLAGLRQDRPTRVLFIFPLGIEQGTDRISLLRKICGCVAQGDRRCASVFPDGGNLEIGQYKVSVWRITRTLRGKRFIRQDFQPKAGDAFGRRVCGDDVILRRRHFINRLKDSTVEFLELGFPLHHKRLRIEHIPFYFCGDGLFPRQLCRHQFRC